MIINAAATASVPRGLQVTIDRLHLGLVRCDGIRAPLNRPDLQAFQRDPACSTLHTSIRPCLRGSLRLGYFPTTKQQATAMPLHPDNIHIYLHGIYTGNNLTVTSLTSSKKWHESTRISSVVHSNCNVARRVRCIRRLAPGLTGARLFPSEQPQISVSCRIRPIAGRRLWNSLLPTVGPPEAAERATDLPLCRAMRVMPLGLQRASEAVQPMPKGGFPGSVTVSQHEGVPAQRRKTTHAALSPP